MAKKETINYDFKTETLTPRTTPFLLGHLDAENEFFKCFKSNRFHHAWLITGEKGIGKATFAYRIIRYIFSLSNRDLVKHLNLNTNLDLSNINSVTYEEDDDDSDDDYSMFSDDEEIITPIIQDSNVLDTLDTSPLKLSPKHPIFERLLAGGITDFKLVTREYSDTSKTKLKSEISVEQIRDLKEFFSKTSYEGGYKVALIDSVDEMNPNSSNAFLKLLEEAPNKSLLLLICNNYESLLDTIKSRCRVLKLKPLSDYNMKTLLKEYVKDISDDDIAELTEFSDGSIGAALNFYNNSGIDIYKLFYKALLDFLHKKNNSLIELTNLVGNNELKFSSLKNISLKFIEKLIKINSNISVNFAFDTEEQVIKTYAKYFKNMDNLFKLREKVYNDFQLVSSLNLDYASVIFSLFERIKDAY